MPLTTLILCLLTLALLSCAIWWARYRLLPALAVDQAVLVGSLAGLRNDVAALLAHAQAERERVERIEREVTSKIGSFLPTDEQARKVEQEHRRAQHAFLSAQTPPPPLSRGSGISGRPSAVETSTPGARNSQSG